MRAIQGNRQNLLPLGNQYVNLLPFAKDLFESYCVISPILIFFYTD